LPLASREPNITAAYRTHNFWLDLSDNQGWDYNMPIFKGICIRKSPQFYLERQGKCPISTLASWIWCETEDLNLIMEFWVFESFCFWIGFYAPRQTEFSPCSQWYLIPEMVFNQILRFFPGLRSVHFKHLWMVHWWVLVHCGPGIGICFFKNGTRDWVGGSIMCGTRLKPFFNWNHSRTTQYW
jgi:hypothetical protein